MKITNSPVLDAYVRSAGKTAQVSRRAATSPAAVQQQSAPTDAAVLTISKEARELAVAAKASDFNSEKVDAIKQRIDSGEYVVSPEKIATRMVEDLF